MSPAEILSRLDELLDRERRALIGIDVEALIGVGAEKSDLVGQLSAHPEAELASLPDETLELARRVQKKAGTNSFLMRHLRGCMKLIGAADAPAATYGRNGKPRPAPGLGGIVRTRL